MNRLFPFSKQTLAPQHLKLAGGRNVSFRELGDPSGRALIALHGTPGSSARFEPAHESARARGIRLIAPDRWGYGETSLPAPLADPQSNPLANPRGGKIELRTYALDLQAIADQLGASRFSLLGVSGGAPYAACAAAVLGPRVDKLALISPVGPVHGRNAARIPAFHAFCFRALPRIPGALRAVYGAHRYLTRFAPELAVRVATARAPPHDKAVIADPDMRRAQVRAFAEGLASSTAGAVLDMRLFSRPWSIASERMAPTRLWIGARDRNVPLEAAIELAQDSLAQLTIIPEAGHLWLSTAWDDVLGWVAEKS